MTNLVLIGYGKMGHAIERAAAQHGCSVVSTVDSESDWARAAESWRTARPDVAVEFSTPATAAGNIRRLMAAGIPVVCGTTGWYADYEGVADDCRRLGGRLLTATNFSLGMNIMFDLNRRLAELMRGRDDYRATITETHHIHKLDAPSGTAVTLQQQIVEAGCRPADAVPITSIREGEVAGTHTVVYASSIDSLTLTHEAHSREGLAVGALVAAKWLADAAPGVYTMSDVLHA